MGSYDWGMTGALPGGTREVWAATMRRPGSYSL